MEEDILATFETVAPFNTKKNTKCRFAVFEIAVLIFIF